MRASTGILIAFGLLLLAAPASAGFLAEKVDEGIYFVSYQRAQVLRGSLIWDTEKKVKRRLERKVNEFCVARGYTHYRFPSLGEIARDENLRAVWELAAGAEAQNTSDNEGTGGYYGGNVQHVHKSRRLLLLASRSGDGWLTCHSDKVTSRPQQAQIAPEPATTQDEPSSGGDGVAVEASWTDDPAATPGHR